MSAWIWTASWGLLDTFLTCRFLIKMLGAKHRYTPLWFYLGSLLYGQINLALSLAVTTRSNRIYNCVCALVLNMLLFHGSIIKKVFFTLWIFCAHAGVFGALFPLAHASAMAAGQKSCSDTMITIVGLASSLIQYLMMEVLQRKLHMLKRDFTDKDALYLLSIILFIFGAIDRITTLFTGIRGWTATMAVPIAWGCSLLAAGGAGLHVYCVIMLEQRLRERAARQQYQMMRGQLAIFKEQYQQCTQIQHDMKNHTLCLKSLLENGKDPEALCYLVQLDSRMAQGWTDIQTGSIFVDALLNPKYRQAKALGIDITISLSVPSEEEIAPVDICCLLANALDNAIEACQRSDGDKWIRMQSHTHKNYWVLEIRNSISAPPTVHKGKFLSSKRKLSYGVGLQNIRTVVERYGGLLELTSETCFTLSVMLPCRLLAIRPHPEYNQNTP